MEILATDVANMKTDTKMEAEALRTKIGKELEALASRVGKLETNNSLRGVEEALARRVQEIEKAMAAIKLSPAHTTKDNATAIVGGLHGCSSAEGAKSWVQEALTKAKVEGIIDIHAKGKGQDFNGLIFVKFESPEKQDIAIEAFKVVRTSFLPSEAKSYMKKDLPAKQRTMFNFLLNLKKLLVVWKFENVSFDDRTGILTIAGVDILQAEVDTFDFKLNWLDQAWKQWEDLTQDPKFLELIKIAEDRLAKAKVFANQKGKGKGPE